MEENQMRTEIDAPHRAAVWGLFEIELVGRGNVARRELISLHATEAGAVNHVTELRARGLYRTATLLAYPVTVNP